MAAEPLRAEDAVDVKRPLLTMLPSMQGYKRHLTSQLEASGATPNLVFSARRDRILSVLVGGQNWMTEDYDRTKLMINLRIGY